jgi:CRP/FNR family transcriptional regulator, cyclic AMP receptor protein
VSARPRASTTLRLEEHPFFRGMDEAFLGRLRGVAYERSFDTGGLLVREGDPAEEFLLVFSGKVALEVVIPDRPRTTIQTVGPGEVLGWSWLVPPRRWSLDARALKPTRVLGLAATDLQAVLDDRPADGYRFLLRLLPVIAERLENTRLQLMDIHGS